MLDHSVYKISVVIPMYNSQDTIVSALESIRTQTAADLIYEVIVINDGSTDNSAALVEEYRRENPDLNICLINKENGGVSSARNVGLKAAKGNWIALLDSDDTWVPKKTEIQIRMIDQNGDIDFLGGDIHDKGQRILFRKINGLYKANIKDICLENFPQTSAAIFRKKIYDEIGGYDEVQKYAEDGNYFLKICANYNYYHLPVKMVQYGGGKPGFGFSGLSANLKGMYEGNVKNIMELKKMELITPGYYSFLRIFFWIKYIRRIILTKAVYSRMKS